MMTDDLLSVLHQWIEVYMRRSMRDFIQFAKENGLSMSQFNSLMHLKRKGSSAVSDIGEHLGVTTAAASQMVERMVQQGWLERTEDPVDRRAKRIALTQKGQAMIAMSIRARQKWLDELDADLTDDERKQVTAALRILLEKTRQVDDRLEGEC